MRGPRPSVTQGIGAHPPPVAGATPGRVPSHPGIPGRGTGSLRHATQRRGQREAQGLSGSCALAGGTGEPPLQAGEAEVRPLDLGPLRCQWEREPPGDPKGRALTAPATGQPLCSPRGDVGLRPERAPRAAASVRTQRGQPRGQPTSSSCKESPLHLSTQLEAADAPGSRAWWLREWPTWPDSGRSTGRHPRVSHLDLPAAHRTFRRL